MPQRYAIIGAGLAGHEAARALRKQDDQAEITIIGAEPHRPYSRPPLSKEVMCGDDDPDSVYFKDEDWYEKQGIQLRLGSRVSSLDPETGILGFEAGGEMSFDKALLATGGRPRELPVPGAGLDGVCMLRTIDDCQAIRERARDADTVAIIGGGFIGMEVAASLTQLGCEVTLLEMNDEIWSRFLEPERARFFREHCEKRGVNFRLGVRAARIIGDDAVEAVELNSGDRVPADMVVVGIGIVLNDDLAKHAGLQLDNGVVVDKYMCTSHPNVYAAGDIARFPDPRAGRQRRIEHWSHARYTGGLAGRNMAGAEEAFDDLSYVWSDIFDLHLNFVGITDDPGELVVRGEWGVLPFAVFYIGHDGRLDGCWAVNLPMKEFGAIRRLVDARRDIEDIREALQQPDSDLKALL